MLFLFENTKRIKSSDALGKLSQRQHDLVQSDL